MNRTDKRSNSASSRGGWQDGLDAPGGRPESSASGSGEFEHRDLTIEDDDSPMAMEAEFCVDGEIVMEGDERKKPKPVSCGQKIKSGLRSLWATRLTEDNLEGDMNAKIKTILRELIMYLFFLTSLSVLALGMTTSSAYYYTKAMHELFLDGQFPDTKNTFRGMTTMQDFWRFTEGPLVTGLYTDWESYYNGEVITSDNHLGFIYHENKLLGVPRMRQLKVTDDSCSVHSDFENEIKQCFSAYSSAVEEKEPFGKNNGTAWVYSTDDELESGNHAGLIATYSGAGYYQDLSRNTNDSLAILADLKQNLWIDRGTRVIFIDFSVYNANINLFCVIKLVIEFPPTGGVIPSWSFRSIKLVRYVDIIDWVIFGCELIFSLFIVYYIIEEALELAKHKLGYFKDIWNWLDIIIIVVSCICIGFNGYRWWTVVNMLEDLITKPNIFPDFEFLSYWQVQFNYAIAVVLFASWLKIFKYVSFNKTMTQLTTTIGKARKDLAGFLLMFMIIFVAFAQLGFLLFGTQVKDFSTLILAMLTLFRIILGDFNFQELESAHRLLGPIYFILYVFFVFFVLLNMFLAIINDTYAEVKAELAGAKNEFEMSEFFKGQYNKMMSKLNVKRDKLSGIQKALKSADKDSDKKIDLDEFRTELKLRGYGDPEIEAAFTKYDIDGDKILDEEEQRKMMEDLEGQRENLNREFDELAARVDDKKENNGSSGDDSDDEGNGGRRQRNRPVNGVAHEEFNVLSRRVDRMEHSIGSIVSKIDAVLVKLEAMEKAKLQRRETMGKLLDNINESDVSTDEMKRDQMERLVREELDRWDRDDFESRPGTAISRLGKPQSRAE